MRRKIEFYALGKNKMLFINSRSFDLWMVSDCLYKTKIHIDARCRLHCRVGDFHIILMNKQYIIMYDKRIIGVDSLNLPYSRKYPVVCLPI